MHIEYVGRNALIESDNVAFTYEVAETPRDFAQYRKPTGDPLDWNDKYSFIGNYIVFPYGNNNDLPDTIKRIIQNNYIAPGIIKKKTQLLWGSGPKLYTEAFEEGKLVRKWVDNDEVQQWLESWDYETYLLKAITDFHHIEGVFTRFVLSRSSRLGKNFIQSLEHKYADRCRLAADKLTNHRTPTHIIVTDWSFSQIEALTEYKEYPLFDPLNPFRSANTMLYSNMYSFCTDYYTVPDIYGSLEWLNRSTAVPLIFKALSKNSINFKYHIISPQAFWDKKAADLKNDCEQRNIEYKHSMLLEYQKNFLNQIAKILGGEENTGKYLHTTKSFTVDGTNLIEHGWEIKVIDQKITDFVEAQIKISQRSDHAVSGGFGMHTALGNVSETGKSDSGSEQLYALKNYLLTGIDIPELITTKAINYAIKANWPKLKLKLGFYHETPQREQDVSSKDRIKNQNIL